MRWRGIMGYDLSVRFSTKEETQTYLKMLNDNIEDLKNIDQVKDDFGKVGANLAEFNTGEDLGVYAPKNHRKKMIGFSGSLIPDQVWMLCIWLATRSTYRVDGDPVIFYDEDPIHILFDKKKKGNKEWVLATEDGFWIKERTKIDLFFDYMIKDKKIMNNLTNGFIEKLMVRVDEVDLNKQQVQKRKISNN
jgi:hypothetical protein